MDTHIFMIHGIASSPLTFYPIQVYLRNCGYKNLHGISYPVDELSFEDSLKHVNKEMEKILSNKEEEIIVIGQSFGGNISNNIHRHGWKIQNAIYICSPLNGARIISAIEGIIPSTIANILTRKAFDYLKEKGKEELPPHNFHTISFGWFNGQFDGCVYEDEAKLREENHTHINWADHRTGFLDIRLFRVIYDILENNNTIMEYID